MTASQSGGRQSCPECGLEFDRSGEVENHFFEQHLVAGGNTAEGSHETGPEAGSGPTGATSGESFERGDTAREPPGATDDAGQPSGSGTRAVSRSGRSRGASVGGAIRSRGFRRSDLIVALFALVCVGGPIAALALAVT